MRRAVEFLALGCTIPRDSFLMVAEATLPVGGCNGI